MSNIQKRNGNSIEIAKDAYENAEVRPEFDYVRTCERCHRYLR